MTEEFGRKYPCYKDTVVISDHAAERISQRFGGLRSQVSRAIIRALKKFKKGSRATGCTYECKAVVSRDSDDGKIVVVTVLYP